MIKLLKKDRHDSLEEREEFLLGLQTFDGPHILVSTCNRVELYHGDGPADERIATHLFRVVTGLESAFLGETAIQGQVKRAFNDAQVEGTVSPGLYRLFRKALETGKMVRHRTGIEKGALSHSRAIAEIMAEEGTDPQQEDFLLIGSGAVMTPVARLLAEKHARTVYITSRTYEHAQSLAEQTGAQPVAYSRRRPVLRNVGTVISGTSAAGMVVSGRDIPAGEHKTIFDLAVPRDIDPALGRRPEITLHNVERIEDRIKGNTRERQHRLERAGTMIERAVEKFCLQAVV